MNHRRMLWMSTVCLGAAGVFMLGGCDQNSKNREALLSEEASTLRMELDKQKTQNRTLTSENQKLTLRNQQLQADLASNAQAPEPAPEPVAESVEGEEEVVEAQEEAEEPPGPVPFEPSFHELDAGCLALTDEDVLARVAEVQGRSLAEVVMMVNAWRAEAFEAEAE